MHSEYRENLSALVRLLVIAGLAFVCFAFLRTCFQPTKDTDTEQKEVFSTIALSQLSSPQSLTWKGQQLLIGPRTETMISSLKTSSHYIHDPRSKQQTPSATLLEMKKKLPARTRSLIPEYYLYYAHSTDSDCDITYLPANHPAAADTLKTLNIPAPWPGGFYDTCAEAYFDLAGRRYKVGNGNEGPVQHLKIPPYQLHRGSLIIGVE